LDIETLEKKMRREEAKRARREKRLLRKLLLPGFFLLMLAAALFAFWWLPAKNREKASRLAGEPESWLARVTVLDTGQGLGILIESGGEAMLIDGGGREVSSRTVATLKNKNITSLRYLLISHYDADHLNGAIGALMAIGAEEVLGPDYEEDTALYRSLKKRLAEKERILRHPEAGEVLRLGSAGLTLLGPVVKSGEANNNSLVIRLEAGGYSMLAGGDAMEQEEASLCKRWGNRLKSDVYLIHHHGSYTSSTEAFLKKVKPSCLLLSCGKDNEYGHPHASVMKRLAGTGASIWRTDKQGEIVFYFTEEGIFWQKPPCEDFSPGKAAS